MSSSRNLIARAFRKSARIVDLDKPISYVDDGYLTLHCFINPRILETRNLQSFEYAISHLPRAAPILEIGSHCSLSTSLLAYYKRNHHVINPLITCDKWEFQNPSNSRSTYVGESPLLYTDPVCFARDSYLRNIKMFSADDLAYTFEMTSDDIFVRRQACKSTSDILGRNYALGGPLRFCLVDRNHAYEYVKRDFLNCDTFLGGSEFILFDDSTLLKLTCIC